MPCYQCHAEFSFFKREYSCKNCGFSFCSSCLKREIEIPKIGHVAKVCESCFKVITKGPVESSSQKLTEDMIPENFKKRVAALEKKNIRPTPYQKKPQIVHQDSVEKRLENLRRDRFKNVPSVEVIEERLSTLRGEKNVDIPTSHTSAPAKTKEEQTRNLLQQEWERNQIDAGASPDTVPSDILLGKNDKETVDSVIANAKRDAELDQKKKEENDEAVEAIRKRLQKLQGLPDGVNPSLNFNTEELSEEEQIQILIKKLSDEARMDDALGANCKDIPVTKKPADVDDEELPWCCICSEDAIVRCYDCDDDLFCRRCFKECHDGPDADHRTVSFQKPRRKS